LAESFETRLTSELNISREKNLFRRTRLHEGAWLNLSGNDYFNLRNNHEVLAQANETANMHGTGSGASPLLSGYLPCHEELIEKLVSWKKKKYGMLFNTGFMANQAVIKHLPAKNDLILADKFIHHSMAQAFNRRSTKFKRYNHLDLDQLEELLAYNINRFDTVFVATESVFSMDGDYPDLKKLIKLKKKYPFILILDEAHGTGILGNTGAGLSEQADVQNDVDIIVGTFGKALAGMGAYVLTNLSPVIQYLTNKAGEYIYSTFLSPYQAGVALASIDMVIKADKKREMLINISQWLRNQLADFIQVETKYTTPIIPLLVGTPKNALKVQELCFNNGILVGAVRPPTVSADGSRVRISLNSDLSKEDLMPFITLLQKWAEK
jgi:8-amino-7-oxononanoate synthase